MSILALEGPAYAGKTTAFRSFRDNINLRSRFFVVEEGSELVDRDTNSLDFTFDSEENAKRSFHFCLEVERTRSSMATSALKEGRSVLMDRSILSMLVFYLTLKSKSPEFNSYYNDFILYVLSMFDLEVKSGSLLLPNEILFLRPKNREVFDKRVKARQSHTAFLAEWDAYLESERSYRRILDIHYKPNSVVYIDTDNDQESLDYISQEVLAIDSNKDEKEAPSRLFSGFLGEHRKLYTMDIVGERKRYWPDIELAQKLMGRVDFNYRP